MIFTIPNFKTKQPTPVATIEQISESEFQSELPSNAGNTPLRLRKDSVCVWLEIHKFFHGKKIFIFTKTNYSYVTELTGIGGTCAKRDRCFGRRVFDMSC